MVKTTQQSYLWPVKAALLSPPVCLLCDTALCLRTGAERIQPGVAGEKGNRKLAVQWIAKTCGRRHGERISVQCDIVPAEPPDSSMALVVGGLWALGVSEQEQSLLPQAHWVRPTPQPAAAPCTQG